MRERDTDRRRTGKRKERIKGEHTGDTERDRKKTKVQWVQLEERKYG